MDGIFWIIFALDAVGIIVVCLEFKTEVIPSLNYPKNELKYVKKTKKSQENLSQEKLLVQNDCEQI